MRVIRSAAALRRALSEPEPESKRGFVATMGALHEGHLSLVRAARATEDVVVMSIFVNPLQFGPQEDFAAYPRDEDRDLAHAEAEGVDVTFVPSVEEMYPPGANTGVRAGSIARTLEGIARPGHFDGVCTVVAKLFNMVEPHRSYFGQKDAQQVAVIKQMVRDLAFGVEIVVCPTVRDADGLALSSRNAYLTPRERERARSLHRALETGRELLESGSDADVVGETMARVMTESAIEIDYASVVDPETFEPWRGEDVALLVVAGKVGRTRLIDNLPVTMSAETSTPPSLLRKRG